MMKIRERLLTVLRLALGDAVQVREDGPKTLVFRRGRSSARVASFAGGDSRDGEILICHRARHQELDGYRVRGISFVDLAGHVYLNLPFALIDRTVRLPPVRTERNHFTRTASRVIHTLLSEGVGRSWSTHGLAEAARVSPASASRAVHQLQAIGVVADEAPGERRRSRIHVPDPERLLIAWAERSYWSAIPRVDLFATYFGTTEGWLQQRFSKRVPIRWALTLNSASHLYGAMPGRENVYAYVDVADREGLWRAAGRLKAIADHGLSTLHLMLPLDAEALFSAAEEREGLPVVDPYRLVVDLWNYPVDHAREQAKRVISSVLRPRWGGVDES